MTREDFINWFEGFISLTKNDIYELGQLYDEVTKPHWISVDDELPKERQSCIILIDRKALQGTPRIRSAVYAPNVMMQQEGFAYNRMSRKHHITHWMPMPQAPKEGGEKMDFFTWKERYEYYRTKGYEQGYEDAINKACEWLEKKAYLYVRKNCETMLEDFRKAMKGGEE